MENYQLREAWSKIQRWYQEVKGHQGSPSSPNQRSTGTNLNPAVGPLQAAPTGGRATTNHVTTGKYCGQAYERREYCGSSAETPDGTGGRTIRHEGRKSEDMATGGNQGERFRHREVGQIGEYNAGSVPGRINPGGNGMDDNGTHTEGWRRVHIYAYF